MSKPVQALVNRKGFRAPFVARLSEQVHEDVFNHVSWRMWLPRLFMVESRILEQIKDFFLYRWPK